MKLIKKTRGFSLNLSSKELHDLLMIMSIPNDLMRKDLRMSTHKWINKGEGIQTHAVWTLIENFLKEGKKYEVK